MTLCDRPLNAEGKRGREEEKVQTQSWIDTITFSLSGDQTILNPQYWLHLQLTEAKLFFWTYGVQFICYLKLKILYGEWSQDELGEVFSFTMEQNEMMK